MLFAKCIYIYVCLPLLFALILHSTGPENYYLVILLCLIWIIQEQYGYILCCDLILMIYSVYINCYQQNYVQVLWWLHSLNKLFLEITGNCKSVGK
jgi:hypothetical protein